MPGLPSMSCQLPPTDTPDADGCPANRKKADISPASMRIPSISLDDTSGPMSTTATLTLSRVTLAAGMGCQSADSRERRRK